MIIPHKRTACVAATIVVPAHLPAGGGVLPPDAELRAESVLGGGARPPPGALFPGYHIKVRLLERCRVDHFLSYGTPTCTAIRNIFFSKLKDTKIIWDKELRILLVSCEEEPLAPGWSEPLGGKADRGNVLRLPGQSHHGNVVFQYQLPVGICEKLLVKFYVFHVYSLIIDGILRGNYKYVTSVFPQRVSASDERTIFEVLPG